MTAVLVTGASGFVGWHIVCRLIDAGHDVTGAFHRHGGRLGLIRGVKRWVRLDLASDSSIEDVFGLESFDAVVRAAAVSDLRACEQDPTRAVRINVQGTAQLAALCQESGARIVFLSSDQVFDGRRGGYVESDPPHPIHVYGRTKLAAEQAIAVAGPSAAVLRLSIVFGPSPQGNRSCSEQILGALERGSRPRLFVDEFRTPIFAADIASAISELVLRQDVGLLHLGGPDRVSRYELGVAVAKAFGYDPALLEPVRLADLDLQPARLPDLAFDTRRARAVLHNPPRRLDELLEALAGLDRARAAPAAGAR